MGRLDSVPVLLGSLVVAGMSALLAGASVAVSVPELASLTGELATLAVLSVTPLLVAWWNDLKEPSPEYGDEPSRVARRRTTGRPVDRHGGPRRRRPGTAIAHENGGGFVRY